MKQGAVLARQEVADDDHKLAGWYQRTDRSGNQALRHCETLLHETTAKFSISSISNYPIFYIQFFVSSNKIPTEPTTSYYILG